MRLRVRSALTSLALVVGLAVSPWQGIPGLSPLSTPIALGSDHCPDGTPQYPISVYVYHFERAEGKPFVADRARPVGAISAGNNQQASNFPEVTIYWGDDTSSAGTLDGANGQFDVLGAHTYEEEGTYNGEKRTYTVEITARDDQGHSSCSSGSVQVTDAPITLMPEANVSAVEGRSQEVLLATFTDADPHAQVADYEGHGGSPEQQPAVTVDHQVYMPDIREVNAQAAAGFPTFGVFWTHTFSEGRNLLAVVHIADWSVVADTSVLIHVTPAGTPVSPTSTGLAETSTPMPTSTPAPTGATVNSSGTPTPTATPKCSIEEHVANWTLSAPCPPAGSDKVSGIMLRPPSDLRDGWKVDVNPFPAVIPFALPLQDQFDPAQADVARFFLPAVLPDAHFKIGSFSIAATEITLDTDGLTIGTASITKGSTYFLINDLRLSPSTLPSAGSVEFGIFGAYIGAENVTLSTVKGLCTDNVLIVLPPRLGSATAGVKGFCIHPDGSVDGTLDRFGFTIGDISASVSGLTITRDGFAVDSASLTLPKYLGGTTLTAESLAYNGASGRLSLKKATGTIDFSLKKITVKGTVSLELKPPKRDPVTREITTPYHLAGDLTFEVAGGTRGSGTAIKAQAGIDVESVDCDIPPAPTRSTCPNPAFLHHAYLKLESRRSIPLGQTGLVLTGLGGDVSTPDNAHLDYSKISRDSATGEILGVPYKFRVEAQMQTADGGNLFKGCLSGTLATTGNFGLGACPGADITLLRTFHFTGGLCARVDSGPFDSVCADYITTVHRTDVTLPGLYAEGQLRAGIPVEVGGIQLPVNAKLTGEMYAKIVNPPSGPIFGRGTFNLNAETHGTFRDFLLDKYVHDIKFTLGGTLGRFRRRSTGVEISGVRIRVDATIAVTGKNDRAVDRETTWLFIDDSGRITYPDAGTYTLAD